MLTIGHKGGPAVRKGDVLFASLAPKTVVVVTESGQKLTCKSATVTAKVVSNPNAPGKATESVTKETLSKCTVSLKGVTVKSVTALNLPYVATVSDSKGNPVKVSGRSKSKPMGFTATVKFGTTAITCSSSAATVTGHESNKGNTISRRYSLTNCAAQAGHPTRRQRVDDGSSGGYPGRARRWCAGRPARPRCRAQEIEDRTPVSVGMRPFVRHTPTMRYLHWPEMRPASAALAVTGCLILAACGSSGSSHRPPAHPKATASTPVAEPTSGPAAEAAIRTNWMTLFNGKAPIPRRLGLLQDGSQFAAFVEAQAKTSFGQAAKGSSAKIASVTITSPSQASVAYEVLLLGTPLLKNQHGIAVYENGTWKVGVASLCGLVHLAYGKTTQS